jgi:hypothetical protein
MKKSTERDIITKVVNVISVGKVDTQFLLDFESAPVDKKFSIIQEKLWEVISDLDKEHDWFAEGEEPDAEFIAIASGIATKRAQALKILNEVIDAQNRAASKVGNVSDFMNNYNEAMRLVFPEIKQAIELYIGETLSGNVVDKILDDFAVRCDKLEVDITNFIRQKLESTDNGR